MIIYDIAQWKTATDIMIHKKHEIRLSLINHPFFINTGAATRLK
jgi:hypothetical protein